MELKSAALSPFTAFHSAFSVRQRTSRIAIPGPFLHWLGITPKSLAAACRSDSIRCDNYLSHPAANPATSSTVGQGTPSDVPNCLREAWLYVRCVLSDSLPDELPTDIGDGHAPWSVLLASEFARCLNDFERNRPRLVIALQGFEPYNAAARAAAYQLEIPVLTLENTAVSTRMIWDSVSGITTIRNAAKSFYWRFQEQVRPEHCQDYCEQLIANTKRLKSQEHASPGISRPMTSDRPTVLFLGQVYTDSSQVFGLRQWKSPVDVLDQCVDWCERHGYGLVVKLHPKESTGVNTVDNRPYDQLTLRKIQANRDVTKRLNELGAVIDHANESDTYDLIDRCDVAVTVNSQTGLEAALRGKSVVCCGDAFYGGLDFTCDAPAPAYFAAAMDQACQPASPTAERNAKTFAYIFFEKYCREKRVESILQLIKENWK